MIVRKIRLRNFRNYEDTEVLLHPGMNLLTGENAQGKTNLLESLVFLSLTRSHRTRNDRLLIRNGCQFAQIECDFEDESEKSIGVIIHQEGKTLLFKKQPVKKSSEFIGMLNVILFSPDDMGIFTDAPRERRRILNQEITKISPSYLHALSLYQGLLKERNAMLKTEDPDIRYLDVLEEQMIRCSADIIRERRSFVASMNQYMPDIYRKISGSENVSGIHYISVADEEDDIEEALRLMYMNSRLHDLENGVTGSGVHREDIEFILDDSNVVFRASQGQKRITLLAFKLALMNFAKERSGRVPVLLLDDVLSELDRTRQERLIRMIMNSCQCVITAVEYPSFLKGSGVKEFRIRDGKVTEYAEGGQI